MWSCLCQGERSFQAVKRCALKRCGLPATAIGAFTRRLVRRYNATAVKRIDAGDVPRLEECPELLVSAASRSAAA